MLLAIIGGVIGLVAGVRRVVRLAAVGGAIIRVPQCGHEVSCHLARLGIRNVFRQRELGHRWTRKRITCRPQWIYLINSDVGRRSVSARLNLIGATNSSLHLAQRTSFPCILSGIISFSRHFGFGQRYLTPIGTSSFPPITSSTWRQGKPVPMR